MEVENTSSKQGNEEEERTAIVSLRCSHPIAFFFRGVRRASHFHREVTPQTDSFFNTPTIEYSRQGQHSWSSFSDRALALRMSDEKNPRETVSQPSVGQLSDGSAKSKSQDTLKVLALSFAGPSGQQRPSDGEEVKSDFSSPRSQLLNYAEAVRRSQGGLKEKSPLKAVDEETPSSFAPLSEKVWEEELMQRNKVLTNPLRTIRELLSSSQSKGSPAVLKSTPGPKAPAASLQRPTLTRETIPDRLLLPGETVVFVLEVDPYAPSPTPSKVEFFVHYRCLGPSPACLVAAQRWLQRETVLYRRWERAYIQRVIELEEKKKQQQGANHMNATPLPAASPLISSSEEPGSQSLSDPDTTAPSLQSPKMMVGSNSPLVAAAGLHPGTGRSSKASPAWGTKLPLPHFQPQSSTGVFALVVAHRIIPPALGASVRWGVLGMKWKGKGAGASAMEAFRLFYGHLDKADELQKKLHPLRYEDTHSKAVSSSAQHMFEGAYSRARSIVVPIAFDSDDQNTFFSSEALEQDDVVGSYYSWNSMSRTDGPGQTPSTPPLDNIVEPPPTKSSSQRSLAPSVEIPLESSSTFRSRTNSQESAMEAIHQRVSTMSPVATHEVPATVQPASPPALPPGDDSHSSHPPSSSSATTAAVPPAAAIPKLEVIPPTPRAATPAMRSERFFHLLTSHKKVVKRVVEVSTENLLPNSLAGLQSAGSALKAVGQVVEPTFTSCMPVVGVPLLIVLVLYLLRLMFGEASVEDELLSTLLP